MAKKYKCNDKSVIAPIKSTQFIKVHIKMRDTNDVTVSRDCQIHPEAFDNGEANINFHYYD